MSHAPAKSITCSSRRCLEFTHQWRFGLLVKRLNEPFVPTHTPMRGTAPSMNLCQLSVSYSGGWLDLKGAAAAFRLLCVWSMGLPRGGPHGSFMFQSGFRGGGPCRFKSSLHSVLLKLLEATRSFLAISLAKWNYWTPLSSIWGSKMLEWSKPSRMKFLASTLHTLGSDGLPTVKPYKKLSCILGHWSKPCRMKFSGPLCIFGEKSKDYGIMEYRSKDYGTIEETHRNTQPHKLVKVQN